MSLKINHITNTLQVDDSAASANIVLVPKGTGFVDLSASTATSNATNTGALVVGGGIGVGGSITVGGSLTVVGGISASITGVSTTATNIGGGSAGQIHIQSAPGVTTFVPAGTDGYLLQYQTGNTASFVSTTTLQVGIATTATNVSGGVVNVTTGTFSSTINATSTITGALKVAGGVGVGGNIYVGSGATPTLYTDTSGNVSLGTTTPTAQLHVFNSINDGVKIRVENSGTGTNSYVQLNSQVNGASLYNYAFAETYTNANARYVAASGLVESTGYGGIGISALSTSGTSKISFYTGGNNERMRISSAGTATIYSSAIANSTTTGALQVVGGVGVGGNMYVGGTVSATNFILNGYQVSTGTYTGGNVADATTFLSTVTILVTATSTSTTTGALQVAGGVGIGRDLYVGGTVTATILRTLSTNIALGYGAGLTTQGQSIAIGNNAGRTSQSNYSVAIGGGAGISTQSSYSVAIGDSAGGVGQGQQAVAIGDSAGNGAQGTGSVAVGSTAGNNTQGANAVAVGRQAGQSMQGTTAVAVGLNAGGSAQGASSVAVGNNAGQTNQGIGSVAIGNSAGTNNQGAYAVAVGNVAGVTYQTTSSIVLNARNTTLNATNAGFYVAPIRGDATNSGTTYGLYYNIATNEITSSTTGIIAGSAGTATNIASGSAGQIPMQSAPGVTTFIPSGAAGTLLQAQSGNTATFVSTTTMIVGYATIATNLSGGSVNATTGVFSDITTVTNATAATSTSTGALRVTGGVGVGGSLYVGGTVTATNLFVGPWPVSTSTGGATATWPVTNTTGASGPLSVAIGQSANAGAQGISLGYFAGNNNQGTYAVAIGSQAGQGSQGVSSVAIGGNAGNNNQNAYSVAVGGSAGNSNQGQQSVAVGYNAGNNNQNAYSVAFGTNAGATNQQQQAVAVGYNAGNGGQVAYAVAVGALAGNTNQQQQAVAVGYNAGNAAQGTYAVAIGGNAGTLNQPSGSIIINASGGVLNGSNAGLYINPVRNDTGNTTNVVYYNATTKELTYTTAGSAATATNISGGSAGQIPIQNSTGSTTFIPLGTTGYVLTASAGSTATWAAVSGLTAGNSTTATNIASGTAGQVPYQTAPGVTSFYGPGTAGQILVSAGTSSPTYTNTSSIYVNRATIADTATTATGAASASFANNITNGAIGQIPIQSSAGVTTFIPAGTSGQVLTFGTNTATWTTAVGNATNATNLSGGAQYQIPYQSGVGATAFSANLEFDGNSLFVNVGSATQLNTGYTNRLNVSGGIVAGTAASTNGSIILQGLYGANGAITNFGTEYSTGGPVLGYGVYPSGVSSGAFLSSGPAALSRGAYTISGNVHNWYIGGSQTTAIGNPVTMTLAMTLTATGALAFSGASNYGSSGYVLQSNGNSAPTWVALSGVSSGSASVANNIAGGSANQIPYQSGAGSTSFTANLTWDGTNLNVNSSPALTKASAASTGLTAYDLSNFLNGKPLSSEVVMRVLMVRSCSFAGNFAGSYASAGTAPSAAAGVSMIIYKQGVAIGTLTFAQNSTSGVFATTGGTAVSFIAGNQLVIQVDNSVNGQDPSFSDMALTLFGTVAV